MAVRLDEGAAACLQILDNNAMPENTPTQIELKERQLQYLDVIVEKHNLPDRSKAIRCLINFAMEKPQSEEAIFSMIRCMDC